jgi:hypothetical protein
MVYNPSKGFPAVAHLRASRGHNREARVNYWLVVGLISARGVDVLFKNGADMLSNEFWKLCIL